MLAFRFTHAFFRQTLYEEIFAAQRLKLHQQVARGLEAAYARRLEEHASELAEHYSQSTDPADLQNALDYSELAAKRAMSVFAYVEAARHLEQALKLQDVLDPDDHAKRCDLLLALGEARMPLGEPRWVADEVAPQAYAVAETLADHARASRACQMALEALHRDNTGIATGTPEFKEWAERADRYAEPGTTDRAYTDIALGRVHIARRARAAGVGLLRGALALARELDDPELLFTAVWQCLRNMPSPRHWREAVALAEEFIDRSRAGVKNRTQGRSSSSAAWL